jgi:hypothetical protein
MTLRLKGVLTLHLPENTPLLCFCLHCNRFICTGISYTTDRGKPHVSMDAQKFRRCEGYRHSCAMNRLISEQDFGDFWFELLL